MNICISRSTYTITDTPLPTALSERGNAAIQNLENCIKIISDNLINEADNRSAHEQRMLLWKVACLNREAVSSNKMIHYVANRLQETLYNIIFIPTPNTKANQLSYFYLLTEELKKTLIMPMSATDVCKMSCADQKGDEYLREYAYKLNYKEIDDTTNPAKFLTHVLRGWKLLLSKLFFNLL